MPKKVEIPLELLDRGDLSVQFLYLSFALLWVILILALKLPLRDPFSLIILSFPLLLYGLAFASVGSLVTETSDDKSAYLSVALLVVIPLLTWVDGRLVGSGPMQREFMNVLMTSVILTLISLLDSWVPEKYNHVAKHMRSALQTASVTLVIYAIYVFSLRYPASIKTITGRDASTSD